MNNRPKYTYEAQGRNWAVYRWVYTAGGSQGTKVDSFQDREEARKECYRLNGWKYTPQINKK